MNEEALRRQLIATRAAIDAALILLSEREGGCRHERIHDLTTMGGPVKRVCQDCGEVLIDETKEDN